MAKSATKNEVLDQTERLPEPAEAAAILSEFELAMVILTSNFYRWVSHCGAASGAENLSSTDLLVLHFIVYRKRAMSVGNLAFALSIQETHLVTYSVKKLCKLGLLKGKRNGKEMLFGATKAAESQFERYMKLRDAHLVRYVKEIRGLDGDLNAVRATLGTMSGIYTQAARSIAFAVDHETSNA